MRDVLTAIVAGLARLLDLAGTYDPPVVVDTEAAMLADWTKVGNDLRTVMGQDLLD